jgi:mannose/cellobiose epimerase-like protein (N-acyl-D-glucosamine 2-epimerase family)
MRWSLLGEKQRGEIADFERVMALVLRQNFKNGFLGKGICKAFDLVGRKPMNTDLPWWNLPETMRAAAFCKKITVIDADARMCDDIFRMCHNAFVQYFVRPDLHLMAYQTITQEGIPVDVIPATADADPGYHTGLSIIDVLDTLF